MRELGKDTNAELICRRNEVEILKYENKCLMHSIDGGVNWMPLPWRANLKIRVVGTMGNFSWPPFVDCFGWRNERISIAWHSDFESEMNIGKFIGVYDPQSKKWSMEMVGSFDLADGVISHWFEDEGFSVFTPIRPLIYKAT